MDGGSFPLSGYGWVAKSQCRKARSGGGGSMTPPYSPVHAARGNTRTAKGWIQEAAKRMLMNNLDPQVAERPEDLIVYGGRGKAARNWECYHTLVATLERLKNHETLLVQS